MPNELPVDDRGIAIQIARNFSTQDGASTALTSPLSYTTNQSVITIPSGAMEFIAAATTDLRISEVSGMARYDIVMNGTKESIPCKGMTAIFIRADASGGTLKFRFTGI